MNLTLIIIIGVIVLLVILTVFGLLSRYRKCPSDQLLVVFGKLAGNKKAAKVYPGGGVFVWPFIQDYKTMSMLPFQIPSHVVGPDKGMVTTHVDIALTTGISADPTNQLNAVNRFLTAKPSEIQDQIKTILDGAIRDIVASMPIEDLNSNRDKFKEEVFSSLADKLTKIGYEIIDINIQRIMDEDDYLNNLGKKKVTEARANALADIAEKERDGEVRKANILKDQSIQIAAAEKDKAVTVAETKQQQTVRVAEIERDKEVSLAEADKVKLSGIAAQEADKRAQVARAKADANIAEAQADADATAKVAQADAEADAAQAEAQATKEIRVAKAQQNQEAQTIQAIQEKEAKKAEFESMKEQRKAEAEKKAGVVQQEAKIAVAEATAKAGKAQAEQVKTVELAKVDAQMTVSKLEQERQTEVNKAKAEAEKAKLTAEKIVPAEMEKQTILINAEAAKQQTIIDAEAKAAAILKEAEADAEKIRMTKNAEAEGIKSVKLAEAEGERALLMADADAKTKIGMIPAEVVKAMIYAGMTPDMIVQYMTVDHIEGIAEAQAKAYEHIHLGSVNVYGNENTAANFMTSVAQSVMPMIQTAGPIKEALGGLFKKKEDTPKIENK